MSPSWRCASRPPLPTVAAPLPPSHRLCAVISASPASSSSPPLPPRPSSRPPSLPIAPLRRTPPEHYPASPFRLQQYPRHHCIASDAKPPRNAPSPSKRPQQCLRAERVCANDALMRPHGLGKKPLVPITRYLLSTPPPRGRRALCAVRFGLRHPTSTPSRSSRARPLLSLALSSPPSLAEGRGPGMMGRGLGRATSLPYTTNARTACALGKGFPTARRAGEHPLLWRHASSTTTTFVISPLCLVCTAPRVQRRQGQARRCGA